MVDAEDGRWAVVLADALLRGRPRAPDGGTGASVSPIVRRATAPTLARRIDRSSPQSVPPRAGARRSRRGAASRGRRARWPSSVRARWGCHWPPSSRRTAGRSSRSISTRAVVASINEGRSHVDEEPGLADLVRRRACRRTAARDARTGRGGAGGGCRRAHRAGHARCRVAARITGTWTRRWTRSRPGSTPGSLVVFETTLPVGDTRERYAPRLAEATGLRAGGDEALRRVLAGAPVQRRGAANLATYPKLVGGLGPASRDGRRRSTTACWTRTSWRCRRPRRPSSQARRHDLPRRQHRPGQRVRALCRPDRRGRDRGHRRGQQPAVQPHPPAGARGRRPLHPGLSALPARPRARSSSWWRARARSTTARSMSPSTRVAEALGGARGRRCSSWV